ncbi:oligosaccharide flippase family protein [Aliikangiella sp. IMCC44359]|uniref:oligosaccharide flippase family protein n=1 Tax=Aliikangiella sp. IMCC44359 TaxID=3459125 RepID=UPI00403B0BFA
MSLYHKFFPSLGWSFLGDLFSRLALPLTFLLLANILLPEDFGIISAALVLITFSQIFWDAGVAKALIQTKIDINKAANAAFWINITLGLLVWFILYQTAELAAIFFGDSRITDVIKILSIQTFLAALCSVQIALLQKNFEFKMLFWIRFLNGVVPSIISVYFAFKGYGYWSLVIGTLSGQSLQTLALWLIGQWKPKFALDIETSKILLRFGIWPALSALFGWCYLWMDSIIVGGYLGTQEMGIYRTGNTFVALVFGLFLGPLLPVLYSLFSSINDSLEQVKRVLYFVSGTITLFVIPVAFGILALSSSIEQLFFNKQWEGIYIVIATFALAHGFSWTISANGEAYKAIGKPQLETIPMALLLIIYLIGYLSFIQYGLITFLKVRLALTFIALPVHWYVIYKYINFPIKKFIFRLAKATLISILMYFTIIKTSTLAPVSFTYLLVQILLGMIIYTLLIYLFDKQFLHKVINICLNNAKKQPKL